MWWLISGLVIFVLLFWGFLFKKLETWLETPDKNPDLGPEEVERIRRRARERAKLKPTL